MRRQRRKPRFRARNSRASQTAANPLSKSSSKVSAANPCGPFASTLVAPILPEPISRISPPPASFVSNQRRTGSSQAHSPAPTRTIVVIQNSVMARILCLTCACVSVLSRLPSRRSACPCQRAADNHASRCRQHRARCAVAVLRFGHWRLVGAESGASGVTRRADCLCRRLCRAALWHQEREPRLLRACRHCSGAWSNAIGRGWSRLPAIQPAQLRSAHVRAALDVPVVGTVPAIKPAAEATQTGVIGLLGTAATIRQPYVDQLQADHAADMTLLRHAAPELVHAAEAKMRGEAVDPANLRLRRCAV